MSAIIKLSAVSKTYQAGETYVEALKPTEMEIERGAFMAIMGPSGSGKSTMLNLLGLLDQPTSGTYTLDGIDVSTMNDDSLSEVRCLKIGMIFQSFNLFPHFSVLENVCVPMRYAQVPEAEMKERAKAILDSVGLGDRIYHRPTQLSGGQCQRVAIARALANNPPVLLADEPTGNLDEKTGEEVLDLFRGLRENGHTIIMVTHNPEYEHIVERMIVLHDGHVTTDRSSN